MSYCPEEGDCFAKLIPTNYIVGFEIKPKCALLHSTNFDVHNGCNGHCPFQKKEKTLTNNKHYPYVNPMLLK